LFSHIFLSIPAKLLDEKSLLPFANSPRQSILIQARSSCYKNANYRQSADKG